MGKTSLVLDMVDVQEHDSGWRWKKFPLHFVSYFLQVNVPNAAHVSRTLDSL